MTHSRFGIASSIAVLIITWAAGAAHAQSSADEAVAFGVQLLERGQYEAAMEAFHRAADRDPDHAPALFYLGATSNRLGDFDGAAYYLDLAEQKGSTARDLKFERGWAQLRTGDYVEAIENLHAYEQAHPGRGQTSEFLGRAWLALGEYGKAERYFNQAIERDPSLEPTALMGLAVAQREQGREQTAVATLDTAAQTTTGTGPAPSRMLRERLGETIERDPLATTDDNRWRAEFTIAAGWTDNVIAATEEAPLPPDISGTESALGRFNVLLSYDVLAREHDSLQVGYVFSADEYEGQFDVADYKGHYFYGDYARRLSDRWTVGLRLSNEYLDIGGESFRNAITARPAATLQLRPDLAVEFAYSYTFNEYFTPTLSVTDRDGDEHNGSMTFHFDVPSTELSTSFGTWFAINDADGGDFDSNQFGFFVSVGHPLVFEIDIEATYAHIKGAYSNDNSLTAFAFPREDAIDVISVELTRPIEIDHLQGSTARLFLRYDFTNNDSNVPAFKYDQHTITGGLVVEF